MKRLENWITTGAYIRDLSELGNGYYIDNYSFAYEKYMPIFDELKKICAGIQDYSDEKTLTCFGRERKWSVKLMNEREDKLSWNTVGRRAVLMNVFAATEINAPRDGEYEFVLEVKGSAAIHINGQSFSTQLKLGSEEQRTVIRPRLKKGKNSCVIAIMNMHIHCMCAFCLMSADDDITAVCDDISELSAEDIKRTEAELSQFFPGKSIFTDGEQIYMECEASVLCGKKYTFNIFAYEGFDRTKEELVRTLSYNGNDILNSRPRLELFPASQLKSGKYVIKPECDGIKGQECAFTKRTRITFPENMDFEQRRAALIDYYAERGVAAAVLEKGGKAVDEEYISEMISEVNGRYDCADFSLHRLLRIYGKYHKQLNKELAEKIKQAILGFKYRADESGETMMFTRSENHQMSFFSCEYVAGILFPDEIFTNSGQNGLFHAFKGRYDCEQWIREKGRYGFCEWYSNAYLPPDIISLLDIHDFSDANPDLKFLAKNLLDFIILLIASHSSKGVMGSVHGRCYEYALKNPEDEGTGHLMWLLYGAPASTYDEINDAAVSLVTSSYRPHKSLTEPALSEEPLETYSRMGLYRYNGRRGVNIYCYRKSGYMLSGLLESRKGEFGAQVQAGQLLLEGKAPIYVTCFESMKSNTRPSYWSGQYKIPKTEAHKNLLVHMYRLEEGKGYTHCFFPEGKFDAVEYKNGWKFGVINNTYAGVYCCGGFIETKSGGYKNQELLCDARNPIWLLAAGDKEEYGSFESFIESVGSGAMTQTGEAFLWQSEAFGEVRLSWEGVCTVGGKLFLEGELPLISNRYAYSEYGSGYVRLNTGDDCGNIIF